jgi:DHA1 family multidrug resistance protein-like MFS transporter
MFGGAVVMLLMAHVRTAGELLACRMLQGCLTGTMTACTALVAGVAPRERSGYALGMMQMAVYLGAALGPFFGGLVADHLGYRVAFHIAGLLLWAGGVLVKYATEEKRPEGTASSRAEPGTFRQVFAAAGFLSAVFVLVMLRFANSVARPIFPLLVRRIYGSLEGVNTVTGSIFTVGAIAAAVTALLFGRLADRWGAKRLLIAFSLFGSAVAVAHVFAQTVGQLFLLRVLLGLTAAGMIPAANAIIRKTTHDHNLGKAYGVTASLRSVGWALGMLAGSTLAAHMGLRAPFVLMGGSLVLTTFVVIACLRPEEQPLETADAP